MIYFISDTHFCHRGSLLWSNPAIPRLFATIEEADEYMISHWNFVVKPEDEVYFLGDFAYKCSKTKAEAIFCQLNGKKHLIKGNHDFKLAANLTNCWESISDIKQLDFINDAGNKQEIIMCHYPMLSWRHQYHGSWHLHGHTHGSLQELNKNVNRYDCSVEVNNYTPISLDQLKEHFKSKL